MARGRWRGLWLGVLLVVAALVRACGDAVDAGLTGSRASRAALQSTPESTANPRAATASPATTATPQPSLTVPLPDITLPRGNWDIYVLDVAGGSTRRLTTQPERDVTPAWSPQDRVRRRW